MPIAHKRGELVFEKLERSLLKLSSRTRPENVHGFRTSTVRLRVLLEELLPERTHNQKKLLKTLGRIRKRAGKLRDLDMQLATLRSLKFAQDPRRKTELTQALIELRAENEKKLRKLLTKEMVREIRKRLKRTAKKSELQAAADPLATARKIVQRVTPPARPSGIGHATLLSEDVLHKLRVAIKCARYAAEFAPKSAESEQFITELKRLQDTLGHWHDWLTLTQAASDRFGDLRESALVAAIHNVTRGKFRLAVAAVASSPITPLRLKPAPTAIDQSRKLSSKTPPSAQRTESAA
jgi:CHAD domain-containing protein